MIKNSIKDNIADTLFIPLYMKYRESNRKKAFFIDPFACKLVEKIDYDFTKYSKAVRSSVGVAIRAGYFDELTRQFIINQTNPAVINIGCGLDTRFQRIGRKVTDKCVMYELDIPEVIDLRRKLIPESDNNIYLSGSMFETDWMEMLKIKYSDADILILVEGVLMYFEKNRVKELFLNLASHFKKAKIIFDVVSGWMCRNSHKHDSVKLTKAYFKFDCDDDLEMEQWSTDLKLESVKNYLEFPEWKKVGLISYWIMKFVPVIKNASRMLCYRIGQ